MILYGIPNCNTVKKAADWLKQHNISFTFHDFKKQGINRKILEAWCRHFGWENVINTKGTTWKLLPEDEKKSIVNEEAAIALMLEKPACIKRPVVECNGHYLIRFNEKDYEKALINK